MMYALFAMLQVKFDYLHKGLCNWPNKKNLGAVQIELCELLPLCELFPYGDLYHIISYHLSHMENILYTFGSQKCKKEPVPRNYQFSTFLRSQETDNLSFQPTMIGFFSIFPLGYLFSFNITDRNQLYIS